MRANAGLALQVRKRGPDDDALTRKLIGKILKISLCRLVVAVDGDVDIYSADDVLWAITGRMHHTAGMQRTRDGYPSLGYILQEYAETSGYGGGEGMGFDATAPYSAQPTFRRAHYPVEGIDLGRWFSHDQVARIRANQSDYARLMARLGG